MGSLYVVEQLSTGKRRALKLMRASAGNDEAARRRFAQEARVGALIESEHVVEVIAAGVHAETNTPWLAMELLEGEDLGSFLDRIGKLSPSATRLVFSQLCHGLTAAHAIPVVHRDLKPENIFLARSRVSQSRFLLKILDFGIAKVLVAGSNTTGNMGTPLWMAPEQAASRAQITPAADVWALGLIAFRMLSGKYFWKEANIEDGGGAPLMREILVDEIPLASARAAELEATLPIDMDAWFAKCTAREPTARYANADEAWQAFEPLLGASHEQISLDLRAPSITRSPSGSAASRPLSVSDAPSAPALASTKPYMTTQNVAAGTASKRSYWIGGVVIVGAAIIVTLAFKSSSPIANNAATGSTTAAPNVSTAPSASAPPLSASTVATTASAPSVHPSASSSSAIKPSRPITTVAAIPATSVTASAKPNTASPLKMDIQ